MNTPDNELLRNVSECLDGPLLEQFTAFVRRITVLTEEHHVDDQMMTDATFGSQMAAITEKRSAHRIAYEATNLVTHTWTPPGKLPDPAMGYVHTCRSALVVIRPQTEQPVHPE